MAIRVVIADDALAQLLLAERDVEIVVQRGTNGEDVLAIEVDPVSWRVNCFRGSQAPLQDPVRAS